MHVSIFTQLLNEVNAVDCKLLEKPMPSLPAVHFRFGLPLWLITSPSKIQTTLILPCTIKASVYKITQAKTKDNGIISEPPLDGKIEDILKKELCYKSIFVKGELFTSMEKENSESQTGNESMTLQTHGGRSIC